MEKDLKGYITKKNWYDIMKVHGIWVCLKFLLSKHKTFLSFYWEHING